MTNQEINIRILKCQRWVFREDLDLLCFNTINIKMKK